MKSFCKCCGQAIENSGGLFRKPTAIEIDGDYYCINCASLIINKRRGVLKDR